MYLKNMDTTKNSNKPKQIQQSIERIDNNNNSDNKGGKNQRRKTPKRKRIDNKSKYYNSNNNNFNDGTKGYWDLFVPLPQQQQQQPSSTSTTTGSNSSNSIPNGVMIVKLINRLQNQSLNYNGCAFVHTCYGYPKSGIDTVEKIYTNKIFSTTTNINNTNNTNTTFYILKRLHIIIENVSDVGYYATKLIGTPSTTSNSSSVSVSVSSISNSIHTILSQYDIVSVCPTNELSFQTICSTGTCIDIITIDYTIKSNGLPYKISLNDIRNCIQHNIIFEICYIPAILNIKYRKIFIRTVYELLQQLQQVIGTSTNRKSKNPFLIISSSGNRRSLIDNTTTTSTNNNTNNDLGPIVLRSATDIANIYNTICGMSYNHTIQSLNIVTNYLFHSIYERCIRYRKNNQQQSQKSTIAMILKSIPTTTTTNKTKIVQVSALYLENSTKNTTTTSIANDSTNVTGTNNTAAGDKKKKKQKQKQNKRKQIEDSVAAFVVVTNNNNNDEKRSSTSATTVNDCIITSTKKQKLVTNNINNSNKLSSSLQSTTSTATTIANTSTTAHLQEDGYIAM